MTRPRRSGLREWATTLGWALGFFILLRAFVLGAFAIPSGSMRPTLQEGDFLFANKLLFGARVPFTHWHLPALRAPRRGDLVIFQSPLENDQTVVKRVVGTPGDTIAMADGRLRVNGDVVPEPYIAPSDETVDPADPQMATWQRPYVLGDAEQYRPSLRKWGPLVVPPDSFFVLGDNRDDSYDSRYWGWLGRDRIEGRPSIIYYSYDPSPGGARRVFTAVRWRRMLSRPK